MTDSGLYRTEGVVLTVVVGGTLLCLLAYALKRSRPDLDLRVPLLTAFVIRIVAAAGLALTSLGQSIRGGDESVFLSMAHTLAPLSFPSGPWLHALTGHLTLTVQGTPLHESGTLQIFLMAGQIRLFDASGFAMRTTMAAISVFGLGLIAAAVYELAGRRAARLTLWLLVIEPANIFYSTALHKEPTLFLATGMIAFGGALVWRRARLSPILMMVLGCLIATGTRTYAGWFLGAGCALVLLHASVRAASTRTTWAIGIALLVLGVGVLSTPAIVNATSNQELAANLQVAQNANTSDNSNLKLAPVDFSSRGAVIVNLPTRMFDLMFRPFPWQVGNPSQQLGVLETLFVLTALVMLIRMARRGLRTPFARAGPLVYPAFMLMIAYSLAVGNAGTGFRYRTQIIPFIIGIVVILREHQRAGASAPARVTPTLVPASAA